MFIGFLMVMAVLIPFFLFIQFLFPALVARRKMEAASGIMLLFYIGLIYLGGFARFRALRYRLSRTYWRGIRGGSDEPGWNYGGEYLGRLALSAMTLWITLSRRSRAYLTRVNIGSGSFSKYSTPGRNEIPKLCTAAVSASRTSSASACTLLENNVSPTIASVSAAIS